MLRRKRLVRDTHALAIVDVRTGGIVLETSVAADSGGYGRALQLGRRHAPGRRAFAIEGAGSFGAGLIRFLRDNDERVFEVGRPEWAGFYESAEASASATTAHALPLDGSRCSGRHVPRRHSGRWRRLRP